VGRSVVHQAGELAAALEVAGKFSGQVLVEEFIAGREITVGILGERALPVVEIIPQHEVYDYECKYTKGRSDYVCPADLTKEQTAEVQNLGLRAFQCLGCTGYGRIDFRMSREGKFYCLEVNTLPGMTALSLVPMAAKGAGLDFPHLLEAIIEQALIHKERGVAVVRG
jgi:D-alanine-D-alanine ligase